MQVAESAGSRLHTALIRAEAAAFMCTSIVIIHFELTRNEARLNFIIEIKYPANQQIYDGLAERESRYK